MSDSRKYRLWYLSCIWWLFLRKNASSKSGSRQPKMFQNRKTSRSSWIQTLKTIVLMAFLAAPAMAEKVVSCHDGDTCRVLDAQGKTIKIRFYGIDAPEIDQPFGKESRDYLESLIKGKDVKIKFVGRSFNRRTAKIYFNGQDIQALMVSHGYAWNYSQYSGTAYLQDEKKARAAKSGLWAQKDVISPYCWRWNNKPCQRNSRFQP